MSPAGRPGDYRICKEIRKLMYGRRCFHVVCDTDDDGQGTGTDRFD